MNINFKPGDNNDVETLLVLIQEFYQLDGYLSFNAVVVRHALMQLLNEKSIGQVWLIQDQSQAIGYVILSFGYSLEYGGRDAFIDEIYINSAYQGQGIGKQAIKFLEEVCISLNIQALHLEVERENISAQNFYHRVGFKDSDRYLMTKKLN
ncbi:GNAT family N-acetyltransferase [Nostoc sp. FACHB-87]|uniref:GNAT family N-acetyltransferase n=1 Tax=Nostocales TaxID=1161 RepID=UPI0016891533|nr:MULTISPECIES: GNAT family N-acetyltransferase [Nostocales]MBD2302169.1 GNAT family N-acetyltransferase [Nostoc sp. FACHB-190]MBD2456619.1 GNAT family N-acetyltransferase [Nostoc sp. FACHB-87]MBD2477967.1 GNAT family N-acetyltransferase [Anabaena sp. FACHB-83]MBD2489908.1 GNAT family N-acetyltransferase [Aulosira sp. FACHB-615]